MAKAAGSRRADMLPLVIQGTNLRLGKDQPEYKTLAVRREVLDGHPCMTSLWEPTPYELELLKAGGAVKLIVQGSTHPPVILSVQPAPPIRGG